MSMSAEVVLRAPELALWEQVEYMEKRRLFLQSYQFSRKRSGAERARRSMVRVRRLICVRLRAARRLPRLLWVRLRSVWSARPKRRSFHRFSFSSSSSSSSSSSECSW